MSTAALALILLSALFHALWNVVVKRVQDRFCLLALAHVFMAGVLTPFLGAGALAAVRETPIMILYLCGATVFFTLYHLGVTGGYRSGDLSLVYPVTTMAPAIVPLWSFIFLGERLGPAGFAGIGLVVAGAYAIQFRSFSFSALADPFRRFDRSVGFALGAALAYSVGAVFDKAGINFASAITWSYMLIVAMALAESLIAVTSRMGYGAFARKQWRGAAGMALILMCSIMTYRLGLKVTDVSYAASVRQVNALFGVTLGIVLFRERLGGLRMTAALFIVAGVAVIKAWG